MASLLNRRRARRPFRPPWVHIKVEKSGGEVIDWLEKYYSSYYTVRREGPEPLVLRADLDVSNQKYILFKQNVYWKANCHEYVYVYQVPTLTEEIYRDCERHAFEAGSELVKPEKDHMYSYITCVIIADTVDETAAAAAKKCRIKKSFRFSLHGWMEVHTAVLDRSTGITHHNMGGRDYAKLFKYLS